ncbi:hypothetical protein [Plantactinospora endophytica]|nr:hypothetical protein [Plantactinospora endophytica]
MSGRVVPAYAGRLDTSAVIACSARGFVRVWGAPSRLATTRDARLGGSDK